MAELNVTPAELLSASDFYAELAARARLISDQAVAEVQHIAETHGPMGYPVAVGISRGLQPHDAALHAKVADFTAYAQRFIEHADAYTAQDRRGAATASPAGLHQPSPSPRPSGVVLPCPPEPPPPSTPPTHIPDSPPGAPPRDKNRYPDFPPGPGTPSSAEPAATASVTAGLYATATR